MPDLTIEYIRACKDTEYFQCSIKGSKNKYTVCYYNFKWHCDCKGQKFHGKCKHVAEAAKKQCNWTEELGGKAVLRKNGEHFCPKCGNETTVHKVGV